MGRIPSLLGVGFAAALSLAGLAGFLILLAREMNVFWLVLAPVIFAVYQIPAVVVYALWKRKYGKKTRAKNETPTKDGGPSSPRPPET